MHGTHCPNCPNSADLSNHLLQQLLHEDNDNEDDSGDDDNDEENDREEVINFQQWTAADLSQLLQQSLLIKEFVESLVDKMNDLTGHSYLARSQAQVLKRCTEELAADEVIILVDFAENFKFMFQDEVQSYHWTQQSCTLSPVVVYFKKDGLLASSSLCFISHYLNHNTAFAHKITFLTMGCIKESIMAHVRKAYKQDLTLQLPSLGQEDSTSLFR